jgi:tRNA A37 methylthiotransferase MiaB
MMCPHLHLSLQSGSSETLRRMGRGHYGPERVADFLERLAGIWKFFGLGADLIAGFPGETEDHFRQTLDVVEGLPLTYAHVFPYSERPGTPAATFPDSVPGHLRRERAKILRQTASRKHLRFLHRLLTEPTMDVVVEENGTGLSQFYVECVLGKTGHVRGRKLVRVRPVDIDGDRLLVRLAGESS